MPAHRPWGKSRGEIQREGRIGVPVIPFDQIAGRSRRRSGAPAKSASPYRDRPRRCGRAARPSVGERDAGRAAALRRRRTPGAARVSGALPSCRQAGIDRPGLVGARREHGENDRRHDEQHRQNGRRAGRADWPRRAPSSGRRRCRHRCPARRLPNAAAGSPHQADGDEGVNDKQEGDHGRITFGARSKRAM